MTSERRLLVEPQDILSVEFVCKKCNVTLGLDPAKEAPTNLVKTECPNCGDTWLPYESTITRAASSFFRSLQMLIRAQAEAEAKKEAGFHMRLHINLDKP